jgi:thiol:disulfide interchange protein
MIRRTLPIVVAALMWFSLPAQSQTPAAPPASDAPGAAKPAKPEREPIYDEKADAKQQIAAAIANAQRENRRVLVQWGANWCGWCHLLHETCATDKDLKKELLYEYDVVLVDIGRFDKNMDLAKELGANLKDSGVPYLTVLDGNGKPIANQETSSLEKGDKHDPAKVLAFLKQHQAEPRAADSVLSEGLDQAVAEKKIVFVHFGAPWCGWCHKMEAWMAQPSVAQMLDKAFVVVKIDIDRMTGGPEVLKRFAGEKEVGVPWFAFVNPTDNATLAKSVDPKGSNIGFPVKPDEIEVFAQMLKKANTNLSQQDIDALLTSLKEFSKPKS